MEWDFPQCVSACAENGAVHRVRRRKEWKSKYVLWTHLIRLLLILKCWKTVGSVSARAAANATLVTIPCFWIDDLFIRCVVLVVVAGDVDNNGEIKLCVCPAQHHQMLQNKWSNEGRMPVCGQRIDAAAYLRLMPNCHDKCSQRI